MIKDRRLGTRRGEGKLGAERIEWKGPRPEKHERIEKEREDQMLEEKKLMTKCIEMKKRINC